MAQQQYGYGYGYGYPPGTAVGYGAHATNYGAAATQPRPPAQQSFHTGATYAAAKTSAAPVPVHQQAPGGNQAGFYQGQTGGGSVAPPTAHTPTSAHQQTPSSGYFGYQQQQQQYRPSQQQQLATPQHSNYASSYYQHPSPAVSVATPGKTTLAMPPSHQGVVYGSSPSVAALPTVAYPSIYSPYYSSSPANRYGGFSTGVKTAQQPGVKPASSAPSYTPSSASYPNAASYAAAQEKVISNYISQKATGGGGGGAGKFPNKKPFNQNNQPVYFCEVCKISCASSMTYKTHLEGKAHKKKLGSQQTSSGGGEGGEGAGTGEKTDNSDRPHYCPLCEVQCTSRDSYEAHIRGARHTKVLNLFRKLGKTIPDIKLPEGTEITNTVSGKKVSVSAPRVNFVGGQQLTSTGATDKSSGPPNLYPPGPGANSSAAGNSQEGGEEVGGEAAGEDVPGVEPVGEQFVVAVLSDPKFPHATFKCTMCDCYFNDEWARKAHAKGRRHRLNYKKLYQSDLYVEPSKTNRRKSERQREQKVTQTVVRGRGGGGARGGARGGGYQLDAEALRRMEAEELSKMHAGMNNPTLQEGVTEEMFLDVPPGGPHISLPHPPPPPPPPPLPPHQHFEMEPPSHFYPSRPRNPRDDRLVMNKHGSICPLDSEVKAVEQAVSDVEGVLKSISDDILIETCKSLSEAEGKEISREEKHRKLKGVMRVGAFARSLMLRGECSVDLVLMCSGKPTTALFHDIARQMPAKFEELPGEVVYNVSEEVGRAAILVISQVEEHRVQVTLTLTSTEMRGTPSPEQTQADEEAGVLHHPSCSAALAALRHTKWFQMVAQGLPSCGILMRVLKDICRRVPAWGVLNSWILELLVQKSLISANPDYTRPGDVFRRVMECVASGIFLPGGTGMQDPCEKGVMDASSCLSAQERVNITLSAQHALRLIAFGKAHLVLGVEPLPPPGTRREPPREDKAAAEQPEPEAKKPRVAEQEKADF